MKKRLTKPYIIEGIKLKKGMKIFMKEDIDNKNHADTFNNFLLKKDGSMMSEDELRELSKGIFDKVKSEGWIEDNSFEAQNDLFSLIKINYARYMQLPSEDQVREFLRTYHKNFRT